MRLEKPFKVLPVALIGKSPLRVDVSFDDRLRLYAKRVLRMLLRSPRAFCFWNVPLRGGCIGGRICWVFDLKASFLPDRVSYTTLILFLRGFELVFFNDQGVNVGLSFFELVGL